MLLQMIPFMNYFSLTADNYLFYRGESTKHFYFILKGHLSIREKRKQESNNEEAAKTITNQAKIANVNNQTLAFEKRPMSSTIDKAKVNDEYTRKLSNVKTKKLLVKEDSDNIDDLLGFNSNKKEGTQRIFSAKKDLSKFK